MFEDDLINAVRKYPCLYDKHNKTVEKKPEIIKKCWENVSVETGEPVERCRLRWKTLRDRFVKENKNYVKRNQVGMWKFTENMEFLREFIDPRRREIKVEENSRDILETNSDERDDESFFSKSNIHFGEENSNSSQKRSRDESLDFEFEDFTTIEIQSEQNKQHIEALIETPFTDSPIRHSSKKSKRSRTHTSDIETKFDMLVTTLNKYFKSRRKEERKSKHEDFFGLLNTYLSKLPEKDQDNLKADILIMVLNKTIDI